MDDVMLLGNGNQDASASDFAALLAMSMEKLRLKTAAHQDMWNLGQEATWAVDQQEGLIVFSFDTGFVVRCPVQIIGTFNSLDGSWLWAWANPSIRAELQADALLTRRYGEQHQLERLLERKWLGSEQDAWEMTALAAKLADAQGAYRGPAGATYVFMTFGTPSVSKSSAEA